MITVLHVDLDAFYASVEQRDDPRLRGKPIIVGGHPTRGVVLAASYEARPFGVRSAMPMTRAVKACPQAIVVPPRMARYAEASKAFFAILDRYSPLVEGLSLDEAFVDVTGEERLFGDGPAIARKIKDDVRREIELVASVGVAPVKMAAKIASDLGKPDGLVVVGDVAAFLAPLPASRLWGVGEVTEAALRKIGITTIGDIARSSPAFVSASLIALARGEDARAVDPDRGAVSMGHEDTFDEDVRDVEELGIELLGQADRACARIREHGYRARTVTIKVKYSDHSLVTRRETLERPTSDGRVVGPVAVRLLGAVPMIARRGVRLTGVSLSNLVDRDAPRQLGFDDRAAEKSEELAGTLDKIAEKFGRSAVKRAVHIPEEEMSLEELRAAVLADPDADEPRLVYADALVERGDPRGELIQVQVALARDPDQPALLKRSDELVARLPDAGWRTYRRGFIDGARMRNFLDRELLAAEPIRTLALDGVAAAEVERAFTDGLLGRIDELPIAQPEPAEGIVRVLGAQLRELTIVDADAPLLVTLLASGALPRLRALGLPGAAGRYGSRIAPEDFRAILDAAPPLERLDFVRRWGVRAADLGAWPHLPALVELGCDRTLGMRVLPAMRRVRALDFTDSDASFLPTLAATHAAPTLERLVAGDVPRRVNDELEALTPGAFPRLREVTIRGTRLWRRAIAGLVAAAPRLGRLGVEPADDEAQELLAAEFPVHGAR